MELADLVVSLLPAGRRSAVVAFVGAGGKTSAMYALAGEMSARGARTLVTTTTRIRDPRVEGGRRVDRIDLLPGLGPPAGACVGTGRPPGPETGAATGAAAPGQVLLVASAALAAEGKLLGITPEAVCALAEGFDCTLVEADGARRLPCKAPGPREPVVPACADLVVGCLGLDCLGRPIGPETVFRPGLFASLVGASPGDTIVPAHLAALAGAPGGLFKGAPRRARRLVALNKADLLDRALLEEIVGRIATGAGPAADAVAAFRFAAPRGRLVALRRQSGEPCGSGPVDL